MKPLLRTLDEILLLVLEETRTRRAGARAAMPLAQRTWPLRSALVYQLAGREDLARWIRRVVP